MKSENMGTLNMNIKTLLALFLPSVFFLGCEQQKLGYADSSRIVKEAARFQSARDSLARYSERWKREAQGLDSLIQNLSSQITTQPKKGPVLDSLLRLHAGKQADLQRFVQASAERARKLEEELMAPQLKSTNDCLGRFLKDKKLTVLLGTQQAGTILAGDPKADFTDEVIGYLNSTCKD